MVLLVIGPGEESMPMRGSQLAAAMVCAACFAEASAVPQRPPASRPPSKQAPSKTTPAKPPSARPAAATPTPVPAPPEPPELSRNEKLNSWKGERVVLPKDASRSSHALYFEPNRNSYGDYEWHAPEDSKKGLPRTIGGSRGTVVDVVLNADTWYRSQVTIELDGSNDRVVRASISSDNLCFVAELEKARTLVGQSWWKKGRNPFVTAGETTWLENIERVTLTRVEWDEALGRLAWYFRTDRGVEGKFDGRRTIADTRFHADDDAAAGLYTRRFHVVDPRQQFPEWSAATWDMIEKREFAIGMTQKMAEVACGDELQHVGAVMTPGGAATIYRCQSIRFIVDNGKVAKFVEPR